MYSGIFYPAYKVRALFYIAIHGLSDYHIFPHYLINDKIFGKKSCVFLLPLHLPQIYFILRRNERDIINVLSYSCSFLYSCLILVKLEIFRQIFEVLAY
jgi:hypothetical protein